jgi:putative transposase
MNDGSYIAPLNSFKKHQDRLRHHQQELSRKVKFSQNWKKEKAKVQKIYIGMTNARKDFLHKITTTISKNHALVCIEDLQVSNMSKSASGTKEKPGKNVRQKSGLNRSILDQGWGMFLAIILQKTTARHRPNSNVLVAITRITPTLSAR